MATPVTGLVIENARKIVSRVIGALREDGLRVETGRFGAEMRVTIVNAGPLTIWLDSTDL